MSNQTRILNVDDNEGNRYLLTHNLEQAGFQVLEANSGAEALQKISLNPDVMILDVRLPDMSGLEICRIIRASTNMLALPVIMLSAIHVEDRDKIQGLDGGADIYLTSPIEINVLVATIKALLRARSAEVNVLKAASRWQSTFDTMNDAVCIVSLQGIITQYNKALEILLEKPASEFVNTSFLNLINVPLTEDNPLIRVQKTHQREETVLNFNNRWFNFAADPILDSTGNIVEVICILTDITEIRENMLQLQLSNAELNNFTSVASHDLREPLRKISAFSARLQTDNLAEEQRKDYLQRLVDAAVRMTHMIDNLLMYAQIDQQHNTQTEVDLTAVVHTAVSDLSILIHETQGSVQLDTLPSIRADLIQMQRLFQNLITNGLKYHRDGVPPIVQVTAQEDEQTVQIRVQDNGVGIDGENTERIFGLFERLHRRNERGGSGLGLAICRKIVQRHNGKITVESTVGIGSTFILSFPTSIKAMTEHVDTI